MNRAAPALVLLLGTLGGSIIAIGVARDLDRVCRRPVTPAEQRESVAAHTPFAWPRSTPNAMIRSISRSPGYSPIAPPLRVEVQGSLLPFRVALRQAAVARQVPQPTLAPARTCRVVDRRDLARQLAGINAGQTAAVDRLIALNDGVDDDREADRIPYGYVAIGPDGLRVKLQYRPESTMPATWGESAKIGASTRQTLGSNVAATVPNRQQVGGFPWDKTLLWSDDCRELIAKMTRAASRAAQFGPAVIVRVQAALDGLVWIDLRIDAGLTSLTRRVEQRLGWVLPAAPRREAVATLNLRRELSARVKQIAATVVQLGPAAITRVLRALDELAWVERRLDEGLSSLATRVKRELWLVTVPQLPSNLRSAELPQGEKR